MMRRRLILVLVAVATLVAPAQVASSTATQATAGTMAASGTVTISGPSSSTFHGGAVHLHTDALTRATVTLSAEVLELDYTWVRGYDAGREDRDSVFRRTTENGNETLLVEDTRVEIGHLNAKPEILGSGHAGSRVETLVDHEARFSTWNDRWLTRVGHSNETMNLEGPEERGYAYQVEGPWIASQAVDAATLEGNFTLFLNNVTLDGTPLDGGSPGSDPWTHWTGERVLSEPAPGVREIESRITILTVTEGVLRIDAPRGLAAGGPGAEVDVDGRVTASPVSGQVTTEMSVFRYDGARLDMVGQGTARLSPLPPGAASQERQALGHDPGIHLEVTGLFEVEPAEDVTVQARQATREPGSALSTWSPWALVVLGLAGALVVARPPLERWWDTRRAERRDHRESIWMATGDKLFEVRDFETALKWYRRIVRAYPRSPQGWNSVAACLEETQAYAEASEAYEQTARLLDDDPQMLISATTCAWRAGQPDRAANLAREALRLDETLGRRRLSKPRFDELRERPEVRPWFQEDNSDPGASYV